MLLFSVVVNIQEFFMENKKSLVLTLVLWFFLGSLGAHRFYLGYNGSAAAQLIMTILGWATMIVVVGFVPLVIVGIWLIVDLVLILTGRLIPADGSELC